jgi:tRNA(Glu) U13 pseudouridine synthase TruD
LLGFREHAPSSKAARFIPSLTHFEKDPSDRAELARAKRKDFQLPKRELDEAVAEHEGLTFHVHMHGKTSSQAVSSLAGCFNPALP